MKKICVTFLIPVVFVIGGGCSTSPGRPLEVRDLRNSALAQLELLNREADRGNYQAALEMMGQCRPLIVAVDDPELLVRSGLSLANILWYLGRADESDRALAEARAHAGESGDAELQATAAVYLERQKLLKMAGSGAASREIANREIAAGVRDRVAAEIRVIKKDLPAQAFAWIVAGLAERELEDPAGAEAAFRGALEIHEKGRYLEQAAYDWYLIASVRSRAGRYEAALEALDRALACDRRAENSHGIGSDWLARGEVSLRMGRAADAARFFRRARDVFAASGNAESAESAESRARSAAGSAP